MDPEDHSVSKRFTLSDLGFLHGPPLKGAVIVTETARDVLRADSAAFMVFDVLAGEMLVRIATHGLRAGQTYPLHRSAIAPMTDRTDVIAIDDMSQDAPQSGERSALGVISPLAVAVLGPDGNPVGALASFDTKPRVWAALQRHALRNLAYLITQEITLHASFATLEIMAGKRRWSHS